MTIDVSQLLPTRGYQKPKDAEASKQLKAPKRKCTTTFALMGRASKKQDQSPESSSPRDFSSRKSQVQYTMKCYIAHEALKYWTITPTITGNEIRPVIGLINNGNQC